MNTALKLVIDKAIDYPLAAEKRDAALDTIYTKLIVLPLQKSWRSKSPSEKRAVSEAIQKNLYTECFECNMPMKCPGFITCMDCYLGEKYRGYISD
jgi:hypothetical protein